MNPLFEVFSDVINHVLDKDPESTVYPWHQEMNKNKELWQEKVRMVFNKTKSLKSHENKRCFLWCLTMNQVY